MVCPFPGMDPYLEDPAFWPDFHRRFITEIADSLLANLPPGYDARIDEQLRLVSHDEAGTKTVYLDVTVSTDALPRHPSNSMPSMGTAVLEPVTIPAPTTDEVRDVWIEVRHLPDQSVVTIIEVLSPANKRGDGFLEYVARRNAILNRPVNLVDIDLLLGGRRLNMGPRLPEGHYYTFVSRANRRQFVDVYAWELPRALPPVAIPLLSPDPDLLLDLAPVFAETYERGRYRRALRYDNAPPAEVPASLIDWCAKFASR
ncbi:MAG: DUF4058 family protein [Tepidisphaerales bacterium]